jgi:hypothetical protein
LTKPNCNDLEEITFYMANKVVHSTTMRDHILFLHASMCFSPTLETWLLAISRGHFITWPGLTTANVRRYLPKSEATAKGHLDQQRKNLRSTKQNLKRGGSRLPPNTGNRTNKLCLRSLLITKQHSTSSILT